VQSLVAHADTPTEKHSTETDAESTPLGRLEAYEGNPESVCFDGDLAGDRLEMLARHFVNLIDDVKLNVTSDGLFYRETNTGNTALAEMYLPSADWQFFSCLSPGTVGLNLREFYDVARRAGTSRVGLSLGGRTRIGDDSPSLLLKEENIFSGIESLQDPAELRRDPTLPEFDFATTATLTDGNQLREFAKAHTRDDVDSTVSVAVSIPTKRDELADESDPAVTFESAADGVDPLVATAGDLEDGVTFTGNIEYDGYGVSGDVHSDVSEAHAGNIVVMHGYYTAKFFKQALGKLRKTETKDVPYTLEFSPQETRNGAVNILRLTRVVGDEGHLRFLLAPRLTNDD